MGLDYKDLDDRTRGLMVEEIETDINADSLYLSDNLSPAGKENYSDLLKEAAVHGTDDSLSWESKACSTHLRSLESSSRVATQSRPK